MGVPMATVVSRSDSPSSTPQISSGGTRRPSPLLRALFTLGSILSLLSLLAWGATQFLAGSGEKKSTNLLHTVGRGDLVVTVTEDGNLESASNVDIKCQVAGGSSILSIVKDGSSVKQGDKLVELDASALEESINQQRIAFEKARSTRIQAEKNFEVAKLAVREYLEGTFKKAVQDADAQITISLENQRSAQNSLEHAERMFRKGYVSSLELEGQRFAVERARLELESARTAKDVLENFTKVKTLQDLESQRDTAEAQMKSEQAAYELEEVRLNRLLAQQKLCTIVATQDGMVVYANEQGGRFGQQGVTIEEGAAVRERQTILRLPDLSKMQVKVNVHESKVEQLKPNMRARIRILDRELQGEVKMIANQPEPGGFFSANVKEYATFVRIDGQPEGLRPGMTAEVEILIAHVKDALLLPLACVVEQEGEFFAWVQKGDVQEKRKLLLGYSNDQFLEVKDGVAEGETVLLNPRAVVAEAREAVGADKNQKGEEVTEKFGKSSGPPAGEGGGSGPGGPGGRRPGGDSGGPGGGPAGPGAGGPGAGGGGRGMNPMQFDADKDGKVSREEAPEPMRNFFDRMDSNSDGFIDAEEIASMRRRFSEGGGGPPGGGPGAGGPGGGGPGAGGPSGGP
jgi:multidrug efflux pump subunit AcrA (membrane-fusion protein)